MLVNYYDKYTEMHGQQNIKKLFLFSKRYICIYIYIYILYIYIYICVCVCVCVCVGNECEVWAS